MKKLLKIIAVIIAVLIFAFFAMQKASIPLETLKQKYTDSSSKFIEIDSMQVHYRIEGKGMPVVLIHGTGSCLQTWNGWTDSLVKNNFQVICLDMPAFGLTGPRKDNDYSVKKYTEFLDIFLQKIGIDTFALAGNSLGGEICWRFALAYPNKVKKMILIDPGGFYSKEKGNGAIIFKLARIKWMANLMRKMDTKYIVKKTLKDVYEDDSKITDEWIQMYYDMSMREGNRESFAARVQLINSEPKPNLANINVPTLIQWGNEDKLIDVSQVSHYRAIPTNKVIIYEHCGHSPQEEIPNISVHDAILFLKN